MRITVWLRIHHFHMPSCENKHSFSDPPLRNRKKNAIKLFSSAEKSHCHEMSKYFSATTAAEEDQILKLKTKQSKRHLNGLFRHPLLEGATMRRDLFQIAFFSWYWLFSVLLTCTLKKFMCRSCRWVWQTEKCKQKTLKQHLKTNTFHPNHSGLILSSAVER